ncbi:hypothetical protein HN011_003309 [Eciton burchellii]|nr:hypothetical protein HN011_003309 [Eciton burchellii]
MVTVTPHTESCHDERNLPTFVFNPKCVRHKKGTSGQQVILKTNHFKLFKITEWSIQRYHVDFAPREDHPIMRKGLLRTHKDKLGLYIYDGTVMYTCIQLPKQMTFVSNRELDGKDITITIRFVNKVSKAEIKIIQFFDNIMKECFNYLKLQQIGRNFYDRSKKITLSEYKLDLWPGYAMSVRQYESNILMCTALTYKVMRTNTLWDTLNMYYCENKRMYKKNFSDAVIDTVILTTYNNFIYRIEHVDFQTTPEHTFKMKNGQDVTFVQYYKKKHNVVIKDVKQPMLVVKSRLKDRHVGPGDTIYLVPELCCATGLTDSMKNNYKLMSSLSLHTRLHPRSCIKKLMDFHEKLNLEHNVKKEFAKWDLKLDSNLLDIKARVLPSENITFGNRATLTSTFGDWSKDMRRKRCFINKKLCEWVLVTSSEERCVQRFIDTLKNVSIGMNFLINQPTIHYISDDEPNTYREELEQILSKNIPQLIFCIVSNNRSDRYAAIKKKCCVDRPVPSQVCLFRTVIHKNIISIATKIAIQINCKLGGAPWHVEIPQLFNFMIVGFDISRDAKIEGKDFAVTIASMNKEMTKYFSIVNAHENGNESDYIATNISKAAKQYLKLNKVLPKNIIIYRDAISRNEPEVINREITEIQKELKKLYGVLDEWRLVFVIVTKRLNVRLFQNNDNPPTGTVIDNFITNPIKYDFFLVSQQVRVGTLNPTSYSIVYDNSSLNPDQMQRLTYKLTHMYFNNANTVRVPAPCHYAQKLAFLVSKFLHEIPNSELQNKLYFL